MKDTDFEKDSHAHSFWEEWQDAAARAGEPDSWLNYIGQGTPALLFPIPSEATAICFTHNGYFSTDKETGESAFNVSGEIPFDENAVINLT